MSEQQHCGGCEGENHDRCVDEGFDCTSGVGQCLPCVGLALPAVDACVCCAASGCQDPTACACSTQGGERRARAVDAVALMREAARIIDLYAGTYQARAYGCAARLRKAADELEGRKG